METLFAPAQLIGYVALVSYVLAYFLRSENQIKIAFSASNIFWIGHYYLIGAHTAAMTTLIGTARNLLSLNSTDTPPARKKTIFLTYSTVALLVGAVTWAGPVTIIPVSATIIFTYTAFYLHGVRFRQACFVIDAAWLFHAFLVSSVGGAVYAIGAMAVNGYMIVKMTRGTPHYEDIGPI